jgi:hypothetical protein
MEINAFEVRKNIRIEFVDKDYTRFALYPLIIGYLIDHLHLNLAFNHVLKTKNSNFSFSTTEYLLTLLTLFMLGIKHLYQADDILSSEKTLAQLLEIRKGKFPAARGLYRLLENCTRGDVIRLDQVNFDLIKKHKTYLAKKRWLNMDIDQTKKLTEGRQFERAAPCYHARNKGKLGLRISSGTVEGLVFSQKLEAGNVGNADAFVEIFDDTLDKLNQISDPIRARRVRLKKIILRIDGGYYSASTFNHIEKERRTRDLEFIVRGQISNKLVKKELAHRQKQHNSGVTKYKNFPHWEEISDDCQVLRLDDIEVLEDVPHTYTVLLIKQTQHHTVSVKRRVKQKKVTVEYLLITTLTTWSSKRIIKQYKKRQTIENIFKDFNQSFYAQKLPTHVFYGNAFYFQMVTLASTVSFFFKTHPAYQEVSQRYPGYPTA